MPSNETFLSPEQFRSSFINAVGREPTSIEVSQYMPLVKHDPSNPSSTTWALNQLTDMLSHAPYKPPTTVPTDTPFLTSGAIPTVAPPASSAASSTSSPASSTNSSSTTTPTYQSSYTYAPSTANSTGYTYAPTAQSAAGTYQPTTTNGQVSAYVPPGQGYSPTNYTAPVSNYASLPQLSPGSLNITGESGFPSFSFDFAQEQANSYNQLKPFYEQLLNFAGGDLDLAKRIIQYTYDQGLRESQAEYSETTRGYDLVDPVEKSQLQTNQNRRGIITSGFGSTERDRLKGTQDLRREAASRALADRESRITSERGFGMEEKQRGFEQESFNLERDRRKEASQMANDKFSIKQTEYQGNLAKAQREEERRIAQQNMEFQKKMFNAGIDGTKI